MINFKHQNSCHCITIYLIMNISFWLVIIYEVWGSVRASTTHVPLKWTEHSWSRETVSILYRSEEHSVQVKLEREWKAHNPSQEKFLNMLLYRIYD